MNWREIIILIPIGLVGIIFIPLCCIIAPAYQNDYWMAVGIIGMWIFSFPYMIWGFLLIKNPDKYMNVLDNWIQKGCS